jgi:DNA-directed RNA polymerase subunit RPC12/RpoP
VAAPPGADTHETAMNARDRFKVKLRCPKCEHRGVARVSEERVCFFVRERVLQVEVLPDGFNAVSDRTLIGGLDIHCTRCSASAWK